MTNQQCDALNKFRAQLAEALVAVRDDVATVKEDEIVDDDVCDSAVAGLQGIASVFNELAEALALAPIEGPEALDRSPYQSDEGEENDTEDEDRLRGFTIIRD